MEKKELLNKFYEISSIHFNNKCVKNGIRIASFNIHYWSNWKEEPCVDKILDDINEIDADIICLQEVSFGKTFYNKYTFDELLSRFKEMGYIDFVEIKCCNWKNAKYGNMILSKLPLSDKKSGFLYQGNTKIKRGYCLAYVPILDIHVCCVHLDVFDESGKTREIQLAELIDKIKNIKDKLILCGDFNCTRIQDYNESHFIKIKQDDLLRNVNIDIFTLKQCENINFVSSFDIINKKYPHSTVWSDRIVDYIFIHKIFPYNIIDTNLYTTTNSDHFALYMTFNPNSIQFL